MECSYCKKEHFIENCTEIICYICKEQHHFSLHTSHVLTNITNGIESHKSYLDKKHNTVFLKYKKLSQDIDCIFFVYKIMKNDNMDSDYLLKYLRQKNDELNKKKGELCKISKIRNQFIGEMAKLLDNNSLGHVCKICFSNIPNRVLLCCGNIICDSCEKLQLSDRQEDDYGMLINNDCMYCKKELRTVKLNL